MATTSGAVAEVDVSLVKEGYRVTRRHDRILYCRSQSLTGTLFASTVCLTAAQIASQKRDLQQSKDLLNQGHATHCVGPERGSVKAYQRRRTNGEGFLRHRWRNLRGQRRFPPDAAPARRLLAPRRVPLAPARAAHARRHL
jgi:hypothetical protein